MHHQRRCRPGDDLATPFPLTVALQAYSGSWRSGHDNVTGGADAPTRSFFEGALDESQIYASAAPFGVQTAIYSAGHRTAQADASSDRTESAERPSADREPSISARTSL